MFLLKGQGQLNNANKLVISLCITSFLYFYMNNDTKK